MVKVVEGGAWRASVLVALLGTAAVANACGGRTVWVEEGADAGESGGASGRGGDYGGGYAGDYGGGGYTGGYGGDYGGTYGGSGYGGVSGDYGGGGFTGGYGGTYGGGGYGGTYGGGGFTGGFAGKGGYGGTGIGGTFGGSAGVGGAVGGCGAASGSGGSSGSPSLGKACSLFCTRFPYSSCSTDLEGPADCMAQCRGGFGLGNWCQEELTDFLLCAGQVLDPRAMCVDGGEFGCAGPGCLSDAVTACSYEYYRAIECSASPPPPCPPPDRPLPPGCRQETSYGDWYCQRSTYCDSGLTTTTECGFDGASLWSCNCFANGYAIGSLITSDVTGDPCQQAAVSCGVY